MTKNDKNTLKQRVTMAIDFLLLLLHGITQSTNLIGHTGEQRPIIGIPIKLDSRNICLL